MGQFSMYLLYGAVMLLWWGYSELKKPRAERKLAKAGIFIAVGLGYFAYAWYTRGAMLIAAAAYNMTFVVIGAVMLLLGALKALAPPPVRNRLLGGVYGALGLGVIAYGLGWL